MCYCSNFDRQNKNNLCKNSCSVCNCSEQYFGGLGIYDYIVELAGSGATVPITGFGANLAKGAIKGVQEYGLLGAFTGGIKAAAGGISAAIFFGYLASLVSKPKMKKQ